MPGLIVTTAQLANLFGVTTRTIQLWEKDKGCPKASHGKWGLRDVLNWWLENIYKAEDDTEAMAEAKLEYWQAKARTERVKADLAEGSSISIDDFKASWLWRVSEVSTGLGSIPLRIATLVVGKQESDIRAILDSEIWKIRDKFSRTGRFTPSPEPKRRTVSRRVKK
jgi:phage terminase Nu1 subunit (DNA packaging protein)